MDPRSTEVERCPDQLDRPQATADAISRLDNHTLDTGVAQGRRRCEPGDTSTDNDHPRDRLFDIRSAIDSRPPRVSLGIRPHRRIIAAISVYVHEPRHRETTTTVMDRANGPTGPRFDDVHLRRAATGQPVDSNDRVQKADSSLATARRAAAHVGRSRRIRLYRAGRAAAASAQIGLYAFAVSHSRAITDTMRSRCPGSWVAGVSPSRPRRCARSCDQCHSGREGSHRRWFPTRAFDGAQGVEAALFS